jgi:hypothetical protein
MGRRITIDDCKRRSKAPGSRVNGLRWDGCRAEQRSAPRDVRGNGWTVRVGMGPSMNGEGLRVKSARFASGRFQPCRLHRDGKKGCERAGKGRQKNAKKDRTKPIKSFLIKHLTLRTKPKRSQNEASKPFRIDLPQENEAKTEPISPLDLICPKKTKPGHLLSPTLLLVPDHRSSLSGSATRGRSGEGQEILFWGLAAGDRTKHA